MISRKMLVVSTAAALAAAASVFAASGEGKDVKQHGARAKAAQRSGPGDRIVRMMARFDANHDGILSADERAAAKEQVKARRAEIRAKVRAKVLERFDANGDGKLDDAERAAAKAAIKAKREAAGKDGKHRRHLRAAMLRHAMRSAQ